MSFVRRQGTALQEFAQTEYLRGPKKRLYRGRFLSLPAICGRKPVTPLLAKSEKKWAWGWD